MLLLLAACATKHKLTSKNELSTLAYHKSKALVLENYASDAAQQKVDSNHRDNWIKIYSQGKVSITKDRFEGEADSIFWYSRQKEWQSENTMQKTEAATTKAMDTEKVRATKHKTQIKEKEKSNFAWWLLVVPIVLLVWLYIKNRLSIRS